MAGGVDELILRLLREYDIPPHLLEVEVTESVMAKMDKILPVLRHLRESGIGIALDDFGTGYSSLAYLRQLPLTALKIDRSFVKDVPGKIEANSVAKIILDMGRQLGLKVVAEGVETEDQLSFLRDSQCDIGQGWLFAKALTPSQFQAKLAKSHPVKKD
jgi:EAL domain-containing protein (putative c-di-GMP-specific phosphodiesterase class I)